MDREPEALPERCPVTELQEGAMQDIIVALYDEHSTAVRVRTALVEDGFATDRVEITSQSRERIRRRRWQ